MSFWSGKSAIVTGAGSGIGKSLSQALVKRGAKVWLSDINGDSAVAAAHEIGDGAVGLTLDVTDAAAVKDHVDGVVATHGHLNAIFNNAGIGAGGIADELETGHFDRCIDVNIRGVTNGFVAAYAGMAERGSGIIVNTASAAGLLGTPGMAPYSMTKFAVVGLTQALRIEAAEVGVQVCAFCPTAIETPILESKNPADTKQVWMPNIREYLTALGGAPYPVDKFVDYALTQVERNQGIIIAPLSARLRIGFGRFFPGVVNSIVRSAYRKVLAQRSSEG